ncbi:DNA primase [Bdellovibrionota bacterium FG-2]
MSAIELQKAEIKLPQVSAGRFPPEFIQKIREAVNLIEVVGEHVVLRKTGSNHVGLCPFHSERTPSFSVSESRQVYYCYGCKKGGDLFSFFIDLHGLSFPDAVIELAERSRIPLPQGVSLSSQSAEQRDAVAEKKALAFRLNRFVAAFFHQTFQAAPSVRDYFVKRGLTPELEQDFYVGFAPDSWDALGGHLAAKKAPLPIAAELGLLRPSTKQNAGGSGFFDLFRDRAMFPILDQRGRVAGFGGRLLGLSSQTASDGPKYLNSPESFIFKKSKIAFGLFQAQKHIRETNEIILVEGYFDVLAMHAAGFKHVVSTCGTTLSGDHLALFRKFADKIIILFDGDRAGIEATERVMEVGLEHGCVLYGAVMPEGKDPDEVLLDKETGRVSAGGLEQMREILAKSEPLLDSRISQAVKESEKGPEALTQALKQVGAWLSKFQDPLGREVRLKGLKEKLNLSQEMLRHLVPGGVGAHAAPIMQSRLAPDGGGVPVKKIVRSISGGGKPQMSQKLTISDRVILRGLICSESAFGQFFKAGSNLPPGHLVSELFDAPGAQVWVSGWVQSLGDGAVGGWQVFRKMPEHYVSPDANGDVSSGGGQGQEGHLRAAISEILGSLDSGDIGDAGGQNSGREFQEEFEGALNQKVTRIWARFSQQIKTKMAEAEEKKDLQAQSELMKVFLDVQRKMKEFKSFI